ncbi:integrase, catalytic region, zinc finger, CCHC-type containing protein [Tanacetum coccineum]|uniref:Integrase, catalytic region, zinc finger, CCHC-type containing protein n=1 Tax=Tanacetum coccineum TaxID=301880 RepID=A0ABQ5IB90_9ASTR
MLEKVMYYSWKSRMSYYMMNRHIDKCILESSKMATYWLQIEENEVSRPRIYSELSPTEAFQAVCVVKGKQISFSRITTEEQVEINSGKQRTIICYNCKEEGHMSKQCTKPKRKRDDSWFKDKVLLVQAQVSCQILHVECIRFLADPGIPVGSDALSESVEIDHLKRTLLEHLKEKESLLQMVTLLKNDFKKEESRNLDREIALEKHIKNLDNIKTNPIVIPDSKETLTLAEESRLKMLLKHKDNMMQEKIKQIDTTPIDYAALNKLYKEFETRFVPQTVLSAEQAFWSHNSVNSSEPDLFYRPTNVEIPKELPKVNMVNTSLKKLKYICYFDVAVEQHRVESKTFEVKMNQALNENERLLGWTKLFAENEHLKQTYKQRYDSIKPARVRSKEQCADLTNQVNLKSMEISDLNACLQEKVLVAHSAYIKRTQEEAAVFRDLVDHIQVNYPLDPTLESACNTKKDRILQTQSSTQKNKVEAYRRKVKSSLKNKDHVVAPKGTAHVQHSKLNANSELKCVKCNGCMLSDNNDLCVLDYINNVNARAKSKSAKKQTKRKVWKPKRKMNTTTTEAPLRKQVVLDNETSKPAVTFFYSRKPRNSKTNVPVSKSKVVQIVLWYLDSGCSKHMTRDRSQLTNFVNKFLGTVKFRNDHVAKILGYGDYQIGNHVTILRALLCGRNRTQLILCWAVL